MSCGPSHGAGIVKNLGKIPEYKSTDGDQWTRATKREIITQCEVWPQDRTCQETTFRLIEKCFEKDQKFIFYFMFALTDVICQTAEQDQFVSKLFCHSIIMSARKTYFFITTLNRHRMKHF